MTTGISHIMSEFEIIICKKYECAANPYDSCTNYDDDEKRRLLRTEFRCLRFFRTPSFRRFPCGRQSLLCGVYLRGILLFVSCFSFFACACIGGGSCFAYLHDSNPFSAMIFLCFSCKMQSVKTWTKIFSSSVSACSIRSSLSVNSELDCLAQPI